MSHLRSLPWALALFAAASLPAAAAEPPAAADPQPTFTVEELTEKVRPSIAVITFLGRNGKTEGIGTGFVVDSGGLIATNYHVIGEARPIRVEFADGKRYEVTEVRASDRLLDLAVLKIDAGDLPALPLGDSSALKSGTRVVAVGNPQGLKHSVVTGVVSARREIDDKPMLQLAIPIEQGNSGGPVLDLQGRVHGIVNMKSLVTPNLGFAIEIDALKPLLAKPNPILMERWLTIGALNEKQWTNRFGARWWQRAGRLKVQGFGTGFGGRSLCLWNDQPPQVPFEVTVAVRFEPESGAAGLVFHADDKDRHYGFYPSGGRLRLSRFDGPDVFSWKVLEEVASDHYRPGQWNWLKVRVEKEAIKCFLNDHLVIESDDTGYTSGQVGLAKFRNTAAEFKQFQLGREIPPVQPPEKTIRRVSELVRDLPAEGSDQELTDQLVKEGVYGVRALELKARQMEEAAERLRELAAAVYQKDVQRQLQQVLAADEEKIDLFHAGLLLAKMDNREVDVEAYRQEMEKMADDLKKSLPAGADDSAKLKRLNSFLFEELGFHGSRHDYYNRANSYLNEVLEDREGIPITLSVFYMELGRRIGLRLEGIGLPGHFVVRTVARDGAGQLIDVYEKGKSLTRKEAEQKVQNITGGELLDRHLTPVTKRAIIIRMLRNLMNSQQRGQDEAILPYLDAILVLEPTSVPDRGMRAVLGYQSGRYRQALADVDWILEHAPEGIDRDRVLELRRRIEERLENSQKRPES